MPNNKPIEHCEALTAAWWVCAKRASTRRDGRPVCKRHVEAAAVRWQGSPEEVRTCPTCGGAGRTNFTGYGVNVTDDLCPDCLGDGFWDPAPNAIDQPNNEDKADS